MLLWIIDKNNFVARTIHSSSDFKPQDKIQLIPELSESTQLLSPFSPEWLKFYFGNEPSTPLLNFELPRWATILWDNAFAEWGRQPFLVPEKVPWLQVSVITKKMEYATTCWEYSLIMNRWRARWIWSLKPRAGGSSRRRISSSWLERHLGESSP